MLFVFGIAFVLHGIVTPLVRAWPANDDWWPGIVEMDPLIVNGNNQPDPSDIDWPPLPPIDPWEPEWPPINWDWGWDGGGDNGGGGTPPSLPPDDCETDGSSSGTAGTNPFHVYDGNASRAITDLVLPGAGKADSLYWMRHHNTVRRGEKKYFGTGGGWRGNWQYDLAYIPSGDELDEPILYFVYPNGMRRVFHRQTDGEWTPDSRFDETIIAAGDGYEITTPDGTQLLFAPMAETTRKGHVTYLLKRHTTAAGYATTLDYNENGLLTQITDADGKQLTLAYQATPLPFPGWRSLCVINDAPQPGQWIEIELDEELSRIPWQRIRLTRRKGQPLAVAEIQVFVPGSDAPLRGIPIGSAGNPEYAFDGDPGTIYESKLPKMYNLIALDRGTEAGATPVSRIRILAAPGQEELLEGVEIKGMRMRPAGPAQPPQLAQVTADDGRFVRYEYDVLVNAFGDLNHPALVRAVYSDGTQASYRYEYIVQTKEPLLVEADDPRYGGRAKRIAYTYQQGGDHGMVHEEKSPVTGGVYASLERDPGDPDLRIVHYTDMKTLRYRVPASANGRVTEYTDSLGRVTRFEYADNGRGRLKAATDVAGRRTDYTRDHKGRVIRIKRSDGREQTFGRDAKGRITQVTDEKGRSAVYERDHAGKITSRKIEHKPGQGRPARRAETTRDAAGRVVKYRSAAGATQEYARDTHGRITAHTGRHGGKIQIARDIRGRRTAMTDSNGRAALFGYDRHGWLDRFTDAEGQTTAFERDERGNITRRVNPDSSTRLYSYDQYGRKTGETDELGRAALWAYDDLSRLVRHVDFAGGITLYDYTETPGGCGSCSLISRPSCITHPDGRIDLFLYDTEGNLLMRSLAAGTAAEAITLYAYDDENRLIRQTNPDGGITRHAYDERGRLAVTTSPLGLATSWTCDDDGRLLESADTSGRITRYAYDDNGNLLAQTAPDGGVTTHAYDDNNRRIQTTDALGGTTRWTYNEAGDLASVVDAAGGETRHAYDQKGRRIKTTLPDRTAHTWAYDALNRVVKTVNPGGLTSINEYDASGRLTAVTTSTNKQEAAVTRHTYDAAGRRTSTTDALGRTTRWTHNARDQIAETIFPDGTRTRNEHHETSGRLLASIDQLGHATRYTYTALGDRAALTDANGNTYSFEYDNMRRKTAMIYPDNTREAWAYDADGRLAAYTTRANQTKTITYNLDGKPLRETWLPSGCAPDVAYTYDETTGKLLTAGNGNALLTYTHDKLGRITSETTDIRTLLPNMAPHTIGYLYDPHGRKAGLVYPDGMKVTYAHDAQDRMTRVHHGKSRPLAIYEYDAYGRRSKLTRDNGVVTTYTYDSASQVLAIDHLNQANTPLAHARYEYDNMGRRTSMTREDNQTDRYRYDHASQLLRVDYGIPTPISSHPSSFASEAFTYDPLGNRIKHTAITSNGAPENTQYATNNLNQYTEIAPPILTPNSSILSYDSNGNLTDDGRQRYRYDAQNRLVEVESATARAVFDYDPRNRCILRQYYTKSDNGGWLHNEDDSLALTYDTAWNLLVDRNHSGRQIAEYVRGNRVDEILANIQAAKAYYPLADALDSTLALTADNGQKASTVKYTAYGLPVESPGHHRFLYTSREWLLGIELNDHRNRYYNPSTGRWLTTDPIRFGGGINLYAYADNNSTNETDPYGLLSKSDCDAAYDADCSYCRSITGSCAAMRKAICWAEAMNRYAACLAAATAEQVAEWIMENPEVVVGTIVVIAAVTFIVATDGLGAIILIPVIAL